MSETRPTAASDSAAAHRASSPTPRPMRFRETRRAVRTVSRSFSSMLGLGLVVIFLFIAAFGPWLAPYPEDAYGAVDFGAKLLSPSPEHWFGTDQVGSDIFSRVLIGARTTLKIGVTVTGIAILIGVPLGLIAGMSGGWIGEVIMRITDIFLSIPGLILAIAIVGALGPGIINAMIALSVVWWPGYVRLVQAKTLSQRNETYVEAARALGAGPLRVAFVHVLPNCLSPSIVEASMDMGMAILGAASLGFLGLGAQPPYPEWGAMISTGRAYLPDWWWASFFPGIAIYLTVLGFNLLGDGLRDVFDPRQR